METKKNSISILTAIICSGVLSVIVAYILANIASGANKEYTIALIIGAMVVVAPIRFSVPKNSFVGMILGAVMVPVTYWMYYQLLLSKGLDYQLNGLFYVIAIGSVLVGGYYGLNVSDDDDDDDDDDDYDSDDRQAESGDDVDDDDEFIADAKYNKNF